MFTPSEPSAMIKIARTPFFRAPDPLLLADIIYMPAAMGCRQEHQEVGYGLPAGSSSGRPSAADIISKEAAMSRTAGKRIVVFLLMLLLHSFLLGTIQSRADETGSLNTVESGNAVAAGQEDIANAPDDAETEEPEARELSYEILLGDGRIASDTISEQDPASEPDSGERIRFFYRSENLSYGFVLPENWDASNLRIFLEGIDVVNIDGRDYRNGDLISLPLYEEILVTSIEDEENAEENIAEDFYVFFICNNAYYQYILAQIFFGCSDAYCGSHKPCNIYV